MMLFQKLFQFYVYSNLHVSLSVVCLTLISGNLFHQNVTLEACFLGCSTFVAYHFTRYMNRLKYGKKHLLDSFSNQYKKGILLLIFLAFSVCTLLMFYLEYAQVVRLVPFGILTILYGVSFIKIKKKRYSIRYIPGLKIFIIAITWAGVVVFFSLEFSLLSFSYFVQLFLWVVVLTIPFDIRDVTFDEGHIKTLPVILGIKKTKILGTFLLMCFLILHYVNFQAYQFTTMLLSSIILCVLVWKSTHKQSVYYASFWIEGIPIICFLLMIFF